MGLMNLLTVGRSLSEAKERPHRYKLLNGALPTFGNQSAIVERKFAVRSALRTGGEVGQAENRSESMKSESVAVAEPKMASMHAFPAGRWTAKVNPFKTEKPAPRPAVQGEFSLDKVKPLRNDLSDSDLELVPQKLAEVGAVKVGEMEVPVVKAQPLLERMKALFARKT